MFYVSHSDKINKIFVPIKAAVQVNLHFTYKVLLYARLVFKCGSPHLNANANAQNDSNASANANVYDSNASANANAPTSGQSNASANANAAFALASANALAFEYKPAICNCVVGA